MTCQPVFQSLLKFSLTFSVTDKATSLTQYSTTLLTHTGLNVCVPWANLISSSEPLLLLFHCLQPSYPGSTGGWLLLFIQVYFKLPHQKGLLWTLSCDPDQSFLQLLSCFPSFWAHRAWDGWGSSNAVSSSWDQMCVVFPHYHRFFNSLQFFNTNRMFYDSVLFWQ